MHQTYAWKMNQWFLAFGDDLVHFDQRLSPYAFFHIDIGVE